MYEAETRWRLAHELVEGFCESDWDADGLAERAAGRLERRPGTGAKLRSTFEAIDWGDG